MPAPRTKGTDLITYQQPRTAQAKTTGQDKDLKPVGRSVWIFNHGLPMAYVLGLHGCTFSFRIQGPKSLWTRESIDVGCLKPLKAGGPAGLAVIFKCHHLSQLWSVFNPFCSYLMCHSIYFTPHVVTLLSSWEAEEKMSVCMFCECVCKTRSSFLCFMLYFVPKASQFGMATKGNHLCDIYDNYVLFIIGIERVPLLYF